MEQPADDQMDLVGERPFSCDGRGGVEEGDGDGDVRSGSVVVVSSLALPCAVFTPSWCLHAPSVERAFVACEQDPGLARAVLGAVPWPRRPLPLRALYSTVPLSISLALGVHAINWP